MRRRAPRLRLALALAVLVAACGGGRSTPEQTFDTLRSALSVRDGATYLTLMPRESRAHFRDRVREWKARLAAGDRPQEFLARLPLPPEEIERLDADEVVTRWMSTSNPLSAHVGWLETASVGEAPAEIASGLGPDEAALVLRGRDGDDRTVWFVREDGRWALDFLRTTWMHRR